MRKKVSKLMAAALILAMSASLVPAGADTAAAKTASARLVKAEETTATDDMATLQGILKKNREDILNLGEGQSVDVKGYFVDELDNIAKTFAGDLACTYKGLKYVSPIKADEKDAFLVTLASGTMCIYDVTKGILHEGLPPSVEVKNVKEIRKVSAGKITVKTVKGKKTTFTTYALNTKLTKSNVYSKSGKTYKKGSKKIKKKAYNKYVKTYKKLKKCKLTAAVAEEIADNPLAFYAPFHEYYYSADLSYYTIGEYASVFRRDDESATDPFQAFNVQDVDKKTENYTRLLLGPNVADPATGKTYQEKEWTMLRDFNMDITQATIDRYDDIQNADKVDTKIELVDVSEEERALPTGGSMKLTRYCVSLPMDDSDIDILVAAEGANQGKIVAIEVGEPMTEPNIIFIFLYDQDDEGQFYPYDILAPQYCYPDESFTLTDTRELTLHYEGNSAAIKDWIIKSSAKVAFQVPYFAEVGNHAKDMEANGLGGFYLKVSDGSLKKLPLDGRDEYSDKFDEGLNQKTDAGYTTEENIAKSIYWTEKPGGLQV